MNSIFTRVSIRKYEDRAVEDEKILEMLRAAMQAPSAGNQQPWEFIVVRDRDVLEKLGSYRFNRVVGERHRFENEEWRDAAALLNDLSSLAPGDPSGDVYARLAT